MAAARQVHLLDSCEDVGGEGGIRKVEEQTRLTSSAGRGGTAWLRALPNRSATRIGNVNMRIARSAGAI